jgi:MFS family permease
MGVHAGIAVGPVIGGLLVAWLAPGSNPTDAQLHVAGAAVFGLNALAFLISLLITLTITGRFQEERTERDRAEHGGLLAGVTFLVRDRVLLRMAFAWLVFVLGMGIGMVADAPIADSFGAGGLGYGLLIACWGTGSVLGTAAGRWMTARTEPRFMVIGAAGTALAAFGVGLSGIFGLVLVSLLVMGICDGLTIVAENGVMQRRTPDAVRSRTMAALEAVLSIGLAVSYLAAGPILQVVAPQMAYVIAGVFAAGATVVLLPLVRLDTDGRRSGGDGTEAEQPTVGAPATV